MQAIEYRPLNGEQVKTLIGQGCSAENWAMVQVAQPFDPSRLRHAHFGGKVRIGVLEGCVAGIGGMDKPAGIYNAYIANCTIGTGVRIANIGVHLANYDIGDGVNIENVGTMAVGVGPKETTFGNGVEIQVLNEGGGREVILFNELSSQFAHLMCLHRYRPKLIEKLTVMARAAADKGKSNRGRVGAGARVVSVPEIVNVNIGACAVINSAASLVDGTILSHEDAPTTVGAGVQAERFIIAEGAQVTGGAIISTSYIGQGCRIGKQFSAEGSLFFANCEGFHGEACSVFAGPYTVTHHKSTLLIAGMFSFYNAGSGTNQSNHMYKLGPVHEGKLERGSKTGSFCYLMWPCRVGPFSVVLGKHTRTFDTADLPFSHIVAKADGRCSVIPGLNLTTVGTVRDGAKWPTRDRRTGALKRDRISFDVFSPMTVGRMMQGRTKLQELYENTDKSVDTVNLNGADIKRVLLRSGQRFYRGGIEMYLLEKVVARIENGLANGAGSLAEALATAVDAVYSERWVDIGGQLMPHRRLDDLCAAVEDDCIADLDTFGAELDKIHAAYVEDEWAWVKQAYKQVFNVDLDDAAAVTVEDANHVAELLLKARSKFLNLVLSDASKEFAKLSRTGFGQDGTAQDAEADFVAVRGEYEANKFVNQMRQDLESLKTRIEKFRHALEALAAG